MCEELPQLGEENTLEERVVVMIIGDSTRDQRPLDGRGGHPNGGGRPPDRGGHPNRGGRPLVKEDTLVEDPMMEEDPLEDKDHQALKDLLGP